MEDCIFCKIVRKELPAFTVFENERISAFLDINPLTGGHILIIPKSHYENLFDIDEELLKEIISITQRLAKTIRGKLSADGINLFNATGRAGEQSVSHFHLHLIPRRINDNLDINAWWRTKARTAETEKLKELARKLKE